MKCADLQENLAEYWDMAEEDERRQAIEAHLESCEACREEFMIWQESTQLIKDTVGTMERPPQYEPMSSQVMQRIYSGEKWRLPVADRIYSISSPMRRNVSLAIAFCMAVFLVGFMLAVFSPSFGKEASPAESIYGLKPVALATGGTSDKESARSKQMAVSVATASIKEPSMIRMGPIRTYPDYLTVLSMLGLTSTLLIMNWLSRTKA